MDVFKICPIVKKTVVVCAAHRLMNHPGACKNLHGHNYIITMELFKRDFNQDPGMVVDFGDIKKHLVPFIDMAFDHKTILQIDDPLIAPLQNLLGETQVTVLPFAPTAENMAWFLLMQLQNYIDVELKWRGIIVQRIDIEETPNNTAYAQRA